MFYINEYEVDRKFGGPEEGGWWYDTGRFIRCHATTTHPDDAEAIAERLRGSYLREVNAGKRPPDSVLSTGDYRAIHIDEEAGADFPRERPYYC